MASVGAAADARVGEETARDVQDDERHHHDAEAPLEPASVAPHPIEHRHVDIASTGPAQRDNYAMRRRPRPFPSVCAGADLTDVTISDSYRARHARTPVDAKRRVDLDPM